MSNVLPIRLQMVFDMIPRDNSRVIDVGSDHALLAIHCLQQNITESVVCTDIHEGPALKSRKALAEAGLKDKSEVYQADGVTGVPLKENDAIVIAGMGGLNIIDIIEGALKDNDSAVMEKVSFVLQIQKSIDEVRVFLAQKGFVIEDEMTCLDRDLFYRAMRVRYDGKPYEITDEEMYYGPVLLRKFEAGDESVINLFNHLNDVYKLRSRSDARLKEVLLKRGILE